MLHPFFIRKKIASIYKILKFISFFLFSLIINKTYKFSIEIPIPKNGLLLALKHKVTQIVCFQKKKKSVKNFSIHYRPMSVALHQCHNLSDSKVFWKKKINFCKKKKVLKYIAIIYSFSSKSSSSQLETINVMHNDQIFLSCSFSLAFRTSSFCYS